MECESNSIKRSRYDGDSHSDCCTDDSDSDSDGVEVDSSDDKSIGRGISIASPLSETGNDR